MIVCFCGLNLTVVSLFTKTEVDFIPEVEDSVLEQHIKGSLRVHVKPPVVAKFNPDEEIKCLMDQLVLPLLIKGTLPMEVELLSNGKVTKYQIERKDMIKKTTEGYEFYEGTPIDRIGLYGLKIDKVGLYELVSVKESNGDLARLVSVFQLVVDCPKASFKIKTDQGVITPERIDKCVNEDVELVIEATGILPLTVLYLEKIGKEEQIKQIETTSALPLKFENESRDEQRERLMKIKSQNDSINVSLKIKNDKVHSVRFARITDGLGNSVSFMTTNTLLPPVNPNSSNYLIAPLDENINVHGHEPPSVDYNSYEAKVKTEYDSRYEPAPMVKIPITFQGTPPFSIQGTFKASSVQKIQLDNIESMHTMLTVHEPGLLKLESLQDKYCSSLTDNKITIEGVDPPVFEYTHLPIKETCFGNIGTKIELILEGEPPFEIQYRIEIKKTQNRNEQINTITEKETFQNKRKYLILKPKEPGEYKYVFEKVFQFNIDV
jgi:hypothetical protein